MSAYYNEIDEYAAEWLRNLIFAGLIADGEVDTRSIEDVRPADLRGFTQCHFFAGIGVWSHSLRRAGWPDDRPVWTGSCPCQPFSSAGQGGGFGDERHLWPAWFHLIDQCRPSEVLGEQVASKAAMPWLDLVQTDLEVLGYTFGAIPFPAASVGAPHIRDRLYWVGHANEGRGGRNARAVPGAQGSIERGMRGELDRAESSGPAGGVAHAERPGAARQRADSGPSASSSWIRDGLADSRGLGGVAHSSSSSTRLEGRDEGALGHERAALERGRGAGGVADAHIVQPGLAGRPGSASGAGVQRGAGLDDSGPLGGFWSDAEWLWCRDEKWRPVEPGTFPLAHRATSRVGRLRAYGNAIVAPQAEEWICVVMECMP